MTTIEYYKEKHAAYPPCMGEADLEVRKVRFLKHLATVYPSSKYGETAADFDKINDLVRHLYQVVPENGPGYAPIALDLERLDPAEALVFWLSGFPTPSNVMSPMTPNESTLGSRPVVATRLFGFNRDSDHPLKRSNMRVEGAEPRETRTTIRLMNGYNPPHPWFNFDETCLVDNDNDGWWEYVPDAPSGDSLAAPFVYLDAETYAATTKNTALLGTVFYPRDSRLAEIWGTAVPMLESFDLRHPDHARWHKPDSFQILCAGRDDRYGPPTSNPASGRLVIFPSGKTYDPADLSRPPVDYADEELDNLSSLGKSPFAKARDEAD